MGHKRGDHRWATIRRHQSVPSRTRSGANGMQQGQSRIYAQERN